MSEIILYLFVLVFKFRFSPSSKVILKDNVIILLVIKLTYYNSLCRLAKLCNIWITSDQDHPVVLVVSVCPLTKHTKVPVVFVVHKAEIGQFQILPLFLLFILPLLMLCVDCY